MVDDKNKKSSKEKVVGLDDEKPQKNSVFDKLKKYLLPAAIGIGSMLVVLIVYVFIFSKPPSPEEDSHTGAAETSQHEAGNVKSVNSGEPARHKIINPIESSQKSKVEMHAEKTGREVIKKGNIIDTINLPGEDYQEIEIDTAAIMKDLDFLFATPGQEKMVKGMTPQDSVDTLNWLEKKMAELDTKIAKFEKKKQELEALEERIKEGLSKVDQAESARITNLARLYDGMKPEEVGKLFANLSDDIVLSILPQMKPANASKILALLPPKRAARISTSMITVLEDK